MCCDLRMINVAHFVFVWLSYRKYNWVYPRLNPIHELDPSIHRKDSSDISVDKIILYLETALKKTKGNEDSAAIVNYGLHLARSTSFDNYKKLITEVINVFKKYEGEAIWRTTTSVWQQQRKEHKRFQTNQVTKRQKLRILLVLEGKLSQHLDLFRNIFKDSLLQQFQFLYTPCNLCRRLRC